jgi:DNA-binding SARP family transcriptional activator
MLHRRILSSAPSQPASQVLQSLEALWVRVTVALAEARLAAGDHAALVPDLEQAVADHPLDEQLHAPLMLALYRAGRQPEALACYRRLHRALDAELGVAPGPALRDLEAAILRQDRALELSAAAVTGMAPAPGPGAVAAGRVRHHRS